MAKRENKNRLNVHPPELKPLQRSVAAKKYFFLDGVLYKMLRQNRAGDILSAWNYESDKISYFVLSDVKKKMKNAYTTAEVARLLNRRPETIQLHVNSGQVRAPIKINARGVNAYGHPFGAMKWSEENVLEMYDYISSLGREYKDGSGRMAPVRLPTRREVIAIMKNQAMFYMHTSDGEFVPVWQAKNN